MFRKFLMTAMVAVAVVFASSATSEAAFQIKFETNGQTAIYDLGTQALVSDTSAPSADQFTIGGLTSTGVFNSGGQYQVNLFALTYQGYSVQLSANMTNVPGDASGALLWMTQSVITRNNLIAGGSSGSTLKITLSATGFTQPTDHYVQGVFDASFPTTTAGTVAETVAYDATNTLFNSPVATTLTYNATAASNPESTQNLNIAPSNLFAITSTLLVSNMGLGAPNQLQGDVKAGVLPTPAPAGLVLFASALPIAGLLRLRRRTATAV